jgi:hypothetical protein
MADEILKLTSQQFQAYFNAMKDELMQETKDATGPLMIELETLKHRDGTVATKAQITALEAQISTLVANDKVRMENDKKNQIVIDNIQAETQKRHVEKKDFGTSFSDVIATEFAKKEAEINAFKTDRHAKLSFELKVGTMVIANVTGDTVASYNNRQGLVPNQKINIRDIIPTTPSPTGMFVTYRETGTSGAIGVQTEGQSKSAIDYSFTEIKTVSHYIAGVVDFTKQLMYALPWLQSTLPRMLLRDFYKKENDYFYSAIQTAATGDAATTGAANTAEQAIQLIANQRTANFNSSLIMADWHTWAQIMATSKGTAYGVPGSVTIDANGNVRMAGVPIIGASFADPGAMTLWDNDELERVETETLSVTFSFENEDNFKKNKVTAKVECFEELNVLRPDAIIDTTTSA